MGSAGALRGFLAFPSSIMLLVGGVLLGAWALIGWGVERIHLLGIRAPQEAVGTRSTPRPLGPAGARRHFGF